MQGASDLKEARGRSTRRAFPGWPLDITDVAGARGIEPGTSQVSIGGPAGFAHDAVDRSIGRTAPFADAERTWQVDRAREGGGTRRHSSNDGTSHAAFQLVDREHAPHRFLGEIGRRKARNRNMAASAMKSPATAPAARAARSPAPADGRSGDPAHESPTGLVDIRTAGVVPRRGLWKADEQRLGGKCPSQMS